jgi:hypothetical protein
VCKFRSWDNAFLRARSCSAVSLSCFSNIFVRASRRSISIACSANCARSWPSVSSPKNSLSLACLRTQHSQTMLSEETIASSEGCQLSAFLRLSSICRVYSLFTTSKTLAFVGRFHTVALPALQTSSLSASSVVTRTCSLTFRSCPCYLQCNVPTGFGGPRRRRV